MRGQGGIDRGVSQRAQPLQESGVGARVGGDVGAQAGVVLRELVEGLQLRVGILRACDKLVLGLRHAGSFGVGKTASVQVVTGAWLHRKSGAGTTRGAE